MTGLISHDGNNDEDDNYLDDREAPFAVRRPDAALCTAIFCHLHNVTSCHADGSLWPVHQSQPGVRVLSDILNATGMPQRSLCKI